MSPSWLNVTWLPTMAGVGRSETRSVLLLSTKMRAISDNEQNPLHILTDPVSGNTIGQIWELPLSTRLFHCAALSSLEISTWQHIEKQNKNWSFIPPCPRWLLIAHSHLLLCYPTSTYHSYTLYWNPLTNKPTCLWDAGGKRICFKRSSQGFPQNFPPCINFTKQ